MKNRVLDCRGRLSMTSVVRGRSSISPCWEGKSSLTDLLVRHGCRGGLAPKVTLPFPGFPSPLPEMRNSAIRMLPLLSQPCPPYETENSCCPQTGHSHTAVYVEAKLGS